ESGCGRYGGGQGQRSGGGVNFISLPAAENEQSMQLCWRFAEILVFGECNLHAVTAKLNRLRGGVGDDVLVEGEEFGGMLALVGFNREGEALGCCLESGCIARGKRLRESAGELADKLLVGSDDVRTCGSARQGGAADGKRCLTGDTDFAAYEPAYVGGERCG